MNKLEVVYRSLDEIIPYENNPRDNTKAIKEVAKSIKEFGFKNPIIIDNHNIIVAGHSRLKAAKDLGLKEVPTIKATDLTDKQIKAFRIADNKVSEYAEWDMAMLEEEMEDLENVFTGFEIEDFEIGDFEDEEDNPYTKKVQTPTYEPKEEQAPPLNVLVDKYKAEELEEEIKASNLNEDEKEFLLTASKRHLKFNYSNIAEYYAHANKEMQDLMEKSALVIIDYDKAIEYGYVKLSKSIEELISDEE